MDSKERERIKEEPTCPIHKCNLLVQYGHNQEYCPQCDEVLDIWANEGDNVAIRRDLIENNHFDLISLRWLFVSKTTESKDTSFRELVQGRIDEIKDVASNLHQKLAELQTTGVLNSDDHVELSNMVETIDSILASLDGDKDDRPRCKRCKSLLPPRGRCYSCGWEEKDVNGKDDKMVDVPLHLRPLAYLESLSMGEEEKKDG